MKTAKFSSIKWQLLKSFFLISFVPVTLLYIFLGFSAWILYNKHIEDDTKKHILLVKEGLKVFLQEDYPNKRNRILNYLKYEERIGHLKIWIFDNRRHLLYALNRIPPINYKKLYPPSQDIVLISRKPLLFANRVSVNGRYYTILYEADKKRSGAIYFFKHIFLFWLVFLVILLIISFVYALLLSYKITNPIFKLKKAAENIAEGNLGIKVNVEADNELAVFADTFNYMARKLKKSYGQLSSILEYFRRFLDIIECIVIYFDANGKIVYANKAINSLGYKESDFEYFSILDICPEIDINSISFSREILAKNSFLVAKNGRKIPYFWTISQIDLEDNRFFIMSAQSLEDIYVLHRKLKEEKEKLLVTLQSIADAVIVVDNKGIVSIFNQKAVEITGWKENEVLGKKIEEFLYIYDENDTLIESPFRKVLALKKQIDGQGDLYLITKQGVKKYISYSASPIFDEGKIQGVVLVLRDITKEKALQEEMVKSEKLKSISLLAGGIAHDFNNILSAILGNVELVSLYVQKDPKISKHVESIQKALNLAKSLTQQLLTFAKGGEPIKEIASLEEIIKDSATFVLVGSNVRCHFDFPKDLWPAEVDRAQISQVIQNLVINSRHAMNNSGNIYIKCRNISPEEAQDLRIYPPKPYVEIVIQDEGCGIPKEDLEKIFEPFYTTKEDGSGLGLAISYSIVHKHGGHIKVHSVLGKGTTFYIYLPAMPDKKEEISSDNEKVQVDDVLEKKYRILVIDDEELVRDTTKEILTLLGYEVETAANGEEGISLYKEAQETGQPFDLVILDLTIPGKMHGKDICKEILRLDLHAKVVVASGYANDPVMSRYKDFGFKACLVKPYTIDQLKEVLHSLLSER